MSSYQTIDLGTPYHDPASPLYTRSLRPPHSTMTHASQLSPLSSDYFSHKPRSFLSHHTDFDEKLAASPNPNNPHTPGRGRRPTRQVAYDQPVLAVVPGSVRPRAPLRRTLIRLLLLCTVIVLASLGWRCESVGCKGRGGGALVGDYVGGGSVVAGWGSPEGMDLSAIWDAPSWGGERQGGEKDAGSSTLDAFRDEEGELVGFGGVDGTGEVVWEDEEREFGDAIQEGDAESEPEQGEEEVAAMGDEDVIAKGDDQEVREEPPSEEAQDEAASTSDASAEAPNAQAVALIDGPIGAMSDPIDGAVEAVIAQDSNAESIPAPAQEAGNASTDKAALNQKGWLGSMGGLF